MLNPLDPQDVVSTAQQHSVTRLLVDLSGNPGGFVDLAYLFVRALHPLLQRPGESAGTLGNCLFFSGKMRDSNNAIFVDTLSGILDSTNAEKFAYTQIMRKNPQSLDKSIRFD